MCARCPLISDLQALVGDAARFRYTTLDLSYMELDECPTNVPMRRKEAALF